MIYLSELTPLNIFLFWLSIFSLSLFIFSFYKLRKSQKTYKNIKSKEDERWLDLELKAQKDYQEIIETANEKAKSIILEANHVNKNSSNNIESSIEEMINNQKKLLEESSLSLSSKYQERVDKVNNQNIELLTNMYKGIEKHANESFEKYKEVIQQQTFEAETIAQTRIKDEYNKLDREMQERKKEMIEKLNNDIFKILFNISKTVIGKSLDFTDHEELILNALDQAKKEGIN